MSRNVPLPQGPSVGASQGGIASWGLKTYTVTNVGSTRSAKLVMEYLHQVQHLFSL